MSREALVPCLLHLAIERMQRWQSVLPQDSKTTIPEWLIQELRTLRDDGATLREVLKHGQRVYPDLTRPMLDTLLKREVRKRVIRVTEAQWEELYTRHFGLGETYERLEQYARDVLETRASRGYINRVLKSMHERRTGYHAAGSAV